LRVKFDTMENVTGMAGLALIVRRGRVSFAPEWGDLGEQAVSPAIPPSESAATYWFFAIALFGAAMTPYEVFCPRGTRSLSSSAGTARALAAPRNLLGCLR
jgi:Mn2+/Fe2+ NRAMP family transporter